MYLDGDQYPTINYTGTEDYFCGSYAFGNDILLHKYQTFSGLYAGMYAILGNDSQEMYNGQQRFLLYRFRSRRKLRVDSSSVNHSFTINFHSLRVSCGPVRARE